MSDPRSFGVILLDADGTIRAADDSAAALLRSSAAALVGKSLFILASVEKSTEEEFRRGIETDGMELHFRVSRGDREEDPVTVRIRSLRGEEGIRSVGLVSAPAEGKELPSAADVAGTVKHDVNNLLMGLLGHVGLLRDRTDLAEAARKKVELIEQQGKKIRDRIADLDAIRRTGGTTS